MRDKAYTQEDFETCFFCNDTREHYIIDGNELTAQYIWTLNSEQREEYINKLLLKIRKDGFPYKYLLKNIYNDSTYIAKQLKKLKVADPETVINKDGFISNSGILCLDICRYMNKDIFWKASGDIGSISVEDVFNNDELMIKVLKNRMGWNTTTEGGKEEPYIFDMSPEMIIQGIKSSKAGYGVSNFRPLVAKYIYSKYLKKTEDYTPIVFDYSCGWGARMLAANSLGFDYIGTDPLTADNLIKFNDEILHEDYLIYKSGSEISSVYDDILEKKGKVDMCMSCPPYFTLERYDSEGTQCYNEYVNYTDWLNEYWYNTCLNCDRILKNDGYFVLIIKDMYNKFNLKDDMVDIINKFGYTLIDTMQYKTSRDHLSGKRKTGIVSKNSEYVLFFKK